MFSRLRVQRYNNSANHQNIHALFLKKNKPETALPYINICARKECYALTGKLLIFIFQQFEGNTKRAKAGLPELNASFLALFCRN